MLGLGLGITMRSSAGAVFNPGTQSLTLWLRDSFTASPWVGTASAGNSGSHDFAEATNPPAVGSALNGFTPPDFDGTNDVLSGAALSTYLSASAFSLWVLFNADAAAADPGASNHYNSPYLFGDSATYMFLAFDAAGVTARVSDGSTFPEVTVACATGGWHLAQVQYGSSTLKVRVDGGSWSSAATCAAIGDLTSTARTGLSYSGAAYNGRIAEIGVSNTTIALATFDDVLTYARSRYSLALT